MNKKYNILLCIISIVVVFVGFELAARIYRIFNPSYLELQVEECYKISVIPNLFFEPRPNCTHIGNKRFNKGVICKFNSCGFRGTEEECSLYNNMNSNGFLNIVGIGDSYTLGRSVDICDTFLKVAQNKLNDTGINSITYNLGVGGYNIEQEYSVLKHKVINEGLRPDIVIWQFHLNDILQHERWSNELLEKFFRYLNIYFYSKRLLGSFKCKLASNKIDNITRYEDLREFTLNEYNKHNNLTFIGNYLSKAKELLDKYNIVGIFLYPPCHEMFSDWSEYTTEHEMTDSKVIAIAKKCGWKHIINTYYKEREYPFKDIVSDIELDHHPNRKGHDVIGNLIADYICKNMIKKSRKEE